MEGVILINVNMFKLLILLISSCPVQFFFAKITRTGKITHVGHSLSGLDFGGSFYQIISFSYFMEKCETSFDMKGVQ